MLKANDPLLPGMEFTIGGETYTAPPLTLGGIKAVMPRLSASTPEVISSVLCVALKRNYPEVTQPWLDDHMTGEEFRVAKSSLAEFLRLSGLIERTASQSGEAPAAA